MASSRSWTPLFLKAEPQKTGVKSLAMVPADSLVNLLGGEISCLEVGVEEFLGGLGDRLEQLLTILGGLIGEFGGDVDGLPHLAVVTLPDVTLHLDQIDDADEVGLGADRQLHDQRFGAETVDDRIDVGVEIGARAVELVDEADAGDAVAVGLAPYGL
jgi:hypothetical protein